MASKVKSKKIAAATPIVGTAAGANLQITAYKNGYLIRGDITPRNAGLKDLATWNERLGAWFISKRRAYEYDHHYGLRLFRGKILRRFLKAETQHHFAQFAVLYTESVAQKEGGQEKNGRQVWR